MPHDYVPLSKRPVTQLREQAEQYRRMAATARMADTQDSLLKLAIRLDAFADQRERDGSEGGSQPA